MSVIRQGVSRSKVPHVLLGLCAAISLAVGLAAGLSRLGLLDFAVSIADRHGAFMLCGFFGTLISLERAVASGQSSAFLVPGLSAAGAVLLFLDPVASGLLFGMAGLGLLGLTAQAAFRLPQLFTGIMVIGAALWPAGTIWWLLGGGLPEASYYWLSFLVMTITAERIELARLRMTGAGAAKVLTAIVALFCLALVAGEPLSGDFGVSTLVLMPLALVCLAVWLAANDIARTTIRKCGLARFSAFALLAGYGWMVIAAALLVILPPAQTASGHDAVIHALGLGFVLSMVFAHAPIILPAVAGARVRYVPALYLPLALLQLSCLLRTSGDLFGKTDFVSLSAWLTLGSLLVYAGLLAGTALSFRPKGHAVFSESLK
ncbi:hypothetical protein [Roseibium suaedae]|uniref:NnrS family protein n=1 Tax=Roseibium suaedae TaxID=735517 RepID=A0A1M7NY10_9HYPH|nr:hypothetical protein [Roseibium suaedae]SHN08678.1 hypothetical protein SAMN05444272_4029 [Roseibium suaedae]